MPAHHRKRDSKLLRRTPAPEEIKVPLSVLWLAMEAGPRQRQFVVHRGDFQPWWWMDAHTRGIDPDAALCNIRKLVYAWGKYRNLPRSRRPGVVIGRT